MNIPDTKRLLCAIAALLLLTGAMFAQGITTNKGAVVLHGSTAACSQPATINWPKVRKKTPEWKTIQAEGVTKGSGRYDILIAEMGDRIKKAVASVANAEGRDCVVRKGDIRDRKKLEVVDLTKKVIEEITGD